MNQKYNDSPDKIDVLGENLEQALALVHLIGEQYEGTSTKFNDHINMNANWAVQRCLERALKALSESEV